jgi:hypothetical protein
MRTTRTEKAKIQYLFHLVHTSQKLISLSMHALVQREIHAQTAFTNFFIVLFNSLNPPEHLVTQVRLADHPEHQLKSHIEIEGEHKPKYKMIHVML